MSYQKNDNFTTLVLIGLITSFFLFCFLLEPKSLFSTRYFGASDDWDVLIFTQNWPTSVCADWKDKKEDATCSMPQSKTDWTVHGIWPTKFGTLGPYFCDPSRPFSPEEIYGLMDLLDEHWTRIEDHKKKFDFWKHEWTKHGTCAAILEPLNTEFKYFSQGIIWNQFYNISNILNKANVSPGSDNINADTIIQGVKSETGKDPFISCYVTRDKQEVYLLEVRLCFDKTLRLVDCDGVRYGRNGDPVLTDCPKDRPILYPSSS